MILLLEIIIIIRDYFRLLTHHLVFEDDNFRDVVVA